MQASEILFYVFGVLAVAFSLMVVMGKNPIASAFSLIIVFFCLAANYALLGAHFLAALQILVYAGAIMVLFVFVIMLLNADIRNLDLGKSFAFQAAAGLACLVLLGTFAWAVVNGHVSSERFGFTDERIAALGGNVRSVSELMFSDYILPFELTSVLLLVGIAGSVALAKRKQS